MPGSGCTKLVGLWELAVKRVSRMASPRSSLVTLQGMQDGQKLLIDVSGPVETSTERFMLYTISPGQSLEDQRFGIRTLETEMWVMRASHGSDVKLPTILSSILHLSRPSI